jgi:hypothetical protein
MNLLWIAGMLAAAMPASAQFVTHPQAGFGVMGSMEDGKQAASLQAAPDTSAACPVAMRAERRWGQAMMQARGGGKPASGQLIYLEIERGEHQAVSVKVTVHGTRAGARMTPVVSEPGAKGVGDAVRSFTLKPGEADAKRIASRLQLDGFTSVQSISLEAVTYADGSGWVAGARQSCSVQPDPLMLVSER